MLARLAALDRDLSTDERLHGDRQAKTDWQEAGASLKDAAARLSRYIKERDIGETSTAGKRLWLVQTYEQIVAAAAIGRERRAVAREFEAYRKRLQILHNNMITALNGAPVDDAPRTCCVGLISASAILGRKNEVASKISPS